MLCCSQFSHSYVFCIKGDDGKDGARGQEGVQGLTGDQGDQGLPGLAGPDGRNGNRGMPGFTGPAGAPGEPGQQGGPGMVGPIGHPGVPGMMVSSYHYNCGMIQLIFGSSSVLSVISKHFIHKDSRAWSCFALDMRETLNSRVKGQRMAYICPLGP